MWNLDILIAGGHVSESERALFGNLPLPRSELNSIHRIQDSSKNEWISTMEVVFGCTPNGAIVRTPFLDRHWYKEVIPEFQYVDAQPRRGEDDSRPVSQARVTIIGRANELYNNMYKKYTTPFTRENIEKVMRDTIPPYSERGNYGQISYILVKERVTNAIVCKDLEKFISRPFDELWDNAMNPVASQVTNIQLDPAQLQAFLKYQKDHQEHQYQ